MGKARKAGAGLQRACSKVKRVIGRPFPKGVSGNPSGRRAGTGYSLTAALKRLTSKTVAESIASRLLRMAAAGDVQAIKVVFDRLDGGTNSPVAVATAATFAQECRAQIIIADNHRADVSKLTDAQLDQVIGPKFDMAAFERQARELFGLPAKPPTPQPTPPQQALAVAATEPEQPETESEPDEPEPDAPIRVGVVDGKDFLKPA